MYENWLKIINSETYPNKTMRHLELKKKHPLVLQEKTKKSYFQKKIWLTLDFTRATYKARQKWNTHQKPQTKCEPRLFKIQLGYPSNIKALENQFLLWWNSHNIKLFSVSNSVAFSTFTMLCNHHLHLVSKHFHQYKTLYTLSIYTLLPSPQPLATTNLLSVSMDLPILPISYK